METVVVALVALSATGRIKVARADWLVLMVQWEMQ